MAWSNTVGWNSKQGWDVTGSPGTGSSPNTLLLLHCDGANGSTSFPDASGHCTVTPTAVTVSTTQSKFGGASALFTGSDGNNHHLSVSGMTGLGTGACTIEGWVYFNTLSYQSIFDMRGGTGPTLFVQTGGWGFGTAATYFATGLGTAPATNTWVHFAFVRGASGDFHLYINGTDIDPTFGSSSADFGSMIQFGEQAVSGGGLVFNGYLDELRVSNIAVYTANFTPPTAAFVS